MKKPLVITIIISAIIGFLGVGAVWYFMDQKLESQRNDYDNKILELEGKINNQLDKEDEFKDWEEYENNYFSVKYLKNWSYKEYKSGQEYFMVAFGENESYFPAAESDQMIGMNISISDEDWLKSSYKESDNVKIENENLGNVFAKKYQLLPGRENDMYGDSKITYYVIEKDGKYIIASNFEDYQFDIFNKMLETLELK
jgi:hypothetical protein